MQFPSHIFSRYVKHALDHPAGSVISNISGLGIDVDTPLLDDLLEDFYIQFAEWVKGRNGWLYIARLLITQGVGSADSTVVKIGYTRKTPQERMNSLQTSGVMNEFELVASFPCQDVITTERIVHQIFQENRIRKEFFSFQNTSFLSIIAAEVDKINNVCIQQLH